jgi:hypothetical protein
MEQMDRRSFVVHLIGNEPINSDKVFDVIFREFPDEYVNVREFTTSEYLNIPEPETVE